MDSSVLIKCDLNGDIRVDTWHITTRVLVKEGQDNAGKMKDSDSGMLSSHFVLTALRSWCFRGLRFNTCVCIEKKRIYHIKFL